jgi:Translationally controlled tumour protein
VTSVFLMLCVSSQVSSVVTLIVLAYPSCSFTSESMDPESTMVYAYYDEGSSSPTFLYPKYALKEEKC